MLACEKISVGSRLDENGGESRASGMNMLLLGVYRCVETRSWWRRVGGGGLRCR